MIYWEEGFQDWEWERDVEGIVWWMGKGGVAYLPWNVCHSYGCQQYFKN